MALPVIAALAPVAATVFNSLFPDKNESQKMQNAFLIEMAKQQGTIDKAVADIIKAEASSQHWLTANWRPIMMLTFGGLIVARWFGWAAPNLSEAEYLKLWDIVYLGIGGYVVGRSVEKTVPNILSAMKK